jgi:hypothetical protein
MKIEEILSASSKLPFHIYFLWILWFSVGAFLLYYTLRVPTPASVTAPEPPRPKPTGKSSKRRRFCPAPKTRLEPRPWVQSRRISRLGRHSANCPGQAG